MKSKFLWWKLIVGYLFFIFFHQVYDILGGNTLGAILGERFESVYTHMKMYFYAYLCLAIVEYFVRRKLIPSAATFWTSRMLIASSFPWMAIAIWFIPVALGFELGNYELGYSLIMTPIGLYFAIRLDEGLENVQFRPALNALIWFTFAATLITYTGFSFHVPNNFFIVTE